MNQSNAAIVLGEFGAKIGLPQIAFSEDRLCTLTFDEIITHFELSEDGSLLNAYLWIADIEPEQRTEVALAVSDANYLFAGTEGATLGMNRQTGDLVLAAQIPDATLTLEIFELALESLVNLAQSWQEKIANDLAAKAPENPVPPAPLSGEQNFLFRG